MEGQAPDLALGCLWQLMWTSRVGVGLGAPRLILATPAIFDAHWSTDKAKMFFHSSSYTANPIACAAAGIARPAPTKPISVSATPTGALSSS